MNAPHNSDVTWTMRDWMKNLLALSQIFVVKCYNLSAVWSPDLRNTKQRVFCIGSIWHASFGYGMNPYYMERLATLPVTDMQQIPSHLQQRSTAGGSMMPRNSWGLYTFVIQLQPQNQNDITFLLPLFVPLVLDTPEERRKPWDETFLHWLRLFPNYGWHRSWMTRAPQWSTKAFTLAASSILIFIV